MLFNKKKNKGVNYFFLFIICFKRKILKFVGISDARKSGNVTEYLAIGVA